MKAFAAVAAIAALGIGSSALAVGDHVMVIDVSGSQYGQVDLIDLGGGNLVEITGIGWNVILTAPAPAWYSDARWGFGDSSGLISIFLTPGAGANQPGPAQLFSSPILKLLDLGLPNIVLADGIFQLSRNDPFNDGIIVKDGSSITIQYNIIPAPGALALVGLAGLVSRRRRA